MFYFALSRRTRKPAAFNSWSFLSIFASPFLLNGKKESKWKKKVDLKHFLSYFYSQVYVGSNESSVMELFVKKESIVPLLMFKRVLNIPLFFLLNHQCKWNRREAGERKEKLKRKIKTNKIQR